MAPPTPTESTTHAYRTGKYEEAYRLARPALDPAATALITDDLAELQRSVSKHAPADEVIPLAEQLRDRLLEALTQKRS
nr:hypothetical protein [Ardenticatena sp.]